MNKISIGLLFLITTLKIKAEEYCWSNYYGYPCCPDGAIPVYEADGYTWGYYNDSWCGMKLPEQECWSEVRGVPCCQYTYKPVYVDMDGDWGYENGNWCGIRNSKAKWNDREAVE